MRFPAPIIGGMFRVPTRLLEGRVTLDQLDKKLTVKHVDRDGVTHTVKMLTIRNGWAIMPRHFAKQNFPDLWNAARRKITDVVFGAYDLPIRIKPRDKQQGAFVDGIMDRIDENVCTDLQANAATGSGKTASSCMVQSQMGLGPVLVIVPTNRIKEAWLGDEDEGKGLRFFYGSDWVERNVGIAQQDRCDYQGKAIVIAMGPSLCSRKYDDEFYSNFSAMFIDELHTFATPVLSQVLGMFNCAVRVGLTATPRKGALQRVIEAHLGPPAIVSTQQVLKPVIHRVLFDRECNIYSRPGEDESGDGEGEPQPIDNRDSLITIFSREKRRQELLADIIFYRGYLRGRNFVGLSDRTDQLLDLKRRLVEMGVPEDTIGIYVDKYRTGETKLTGKLETVNPKTKKTVSLHFRGLDGFKNKSAAQVYVRKQVEAFAKKHGVPIVNVYITEKFSPFERKVTQEEYDYIEKHCQIILATYGSFRMGIDVRRLDMGMELSPRGDVEQPIGRVLRIDPGKPVPEWYSIYDRIHTVQERVILGKRIFNTYYHRTPKRLEKQRLTSYSNQQATLQRMDKPFEALEALKASYAACQEA